MNTHFELDELEDNHKYKISVSIKLTGTGKEIQEILFGSLFEYDIESVNIMEINESGTKTILSNEVISESNTSFTTISNNN